MSTAKKVKKHAAEQSGSQDSKPFLIITGMHRSGTSFLARALNLAGVYLGRPEDLISDQWRPLSDNLRGHWEHRKFLALAEKTLSLNGGRWDEPPKMISINEELGNEIAELARELQSHPSLAAGFKDPRILLCFDSWQKYMPKNLVVVGIFRDPVKVADSLRRRNQFTYEKSLKLWQIYNESLLSIVEKNGGFLLDFDWPEERLLSEVRLVARKLGLADTIDLSEWYSEDLIHSDTTKPTDEIIESLYSRLKSRSESNKERVVSVSVVAQSDVIRGLLSDIQAQGAYFKKINDEKLHALKKLESDLVSRENRIGDLVDTLKSREEWIGKLQHEVATADSKVLALQKEFDDRTKWAIELDKVVKDKDNLTAQLRKELQEKTKWAIELDSEIVQKNEAIVRLQQDLQEKIAWASKLDKERKEKDAEMMQLQKEFDDRTKWALELQNRLDALNSEIQARSASIEQLSKDLSMLESHNLSLKNDLAVKESQLAEINGSIIFGIVRRFAGFIDKIAPPNTSRRRFVALVRTAFLVRRQHGTNVMLYHAKKKVVNDLKQKVQPRHSSETTFVEPESSPSSGGGMQKAVTLQQSEIICPEEKHLAADSSLRNFLAFGSHNISRLDSYPLVSIIIPTYDNLEDLKKNISSLETKTAYPNYGIIIVTNNRDANSVLRKYLSTTKHQVYVYEDEYSFSGVNNLGASKANGELLLFLNDDTEVTDPQWLHALVKLAIDPRTGAVGGKMLYPDGSLQEAGGIIWGDGNAWNYGRFWLRPDDPDVNYVREVDYCSASFLLVKKSVFEEVGGFDMQFSPAYYEDTDLCFAIRDRGYSVLYQPLSVIMHKEGATQGTNVAKGMKAYQPINQKKLYDKWRHRFEGCMLASYDNAIVERSRKLGKRILYIDHYAPTPDRDSGSQRTFYTLGLLSWLGYNVTFWPDNLYRSEPYTTELQQKGIEVIYGSHKLEDFLKQRGKYYDIVIMSRPHISINYIDRVRKLVPHCRVLYDTVDLHYVRMSRQATIENKPEVAEEARKYKELEMRLINSSDLTFVVSQEEAAILRQEGVSGSVAVLPNIHIPVEKVRPFESRENVIFVGGFQHTPNIDAAIFLAKEIFPLIKSRTGSIKLFIIGSNPPDSVKELASLDKDIIVTGYVPDITSFLQICRIMVAPLRYGAGIKGKITESMSYGLPVVTTTVGAEGLSAADGESIMIADSSEEIAEKVALLYTDRVLWNKISLNSYEIAAKRYAPEIIAKHLRNIF